MANGENAEMLVVESIVDGVGKPAESPRPDFAKDHPANVRTLRESSNRVVNLVKE